MDSKIFLGKYRISGAEINAVGELADSPRAYEGEEIASGKKVVVEVVPAAPLTPAILTKLEAEAKAAKKLTHVNIPALYNFGIEDGHLVYVTEDFEGTRAEEWVKTYGPMPVGPVLRIAAQVVSALGAAASQRISHHAIHPGNLVLAPGQTAEGEWPLVKVLHFVGGAPKFSETGVSVAAFDKALHYVSPEQLRKGEVDFRSEIYSLGCTMWFLLTGAPPLTTPTGPMAEPLTQTGLAQTGPALDKISGLPKKIGHLLAQMLSLDPDVRPGDSLAFYQQLQDCLAEVKQRETMGRRLGSTRGVDPASRERRPRRALALAAVLLASAILAALAVTGYLRHRRVAQGDEPMGVPVGVVAAIPSAAPATVDTANAKTSEAAQPTAAVVADSNSMRSESPASSENNNRPSVTIETVEDSSTKQVVAANVQPTTSVSAANPPTQEPAPDPKNEAINLRPVPNSPEVASTRRVEAAPTPAGSTNGEVREIEQTTAPKEIMVREVRRAELVEEPEVRRAEPALKENPIKAAPDAATSSALQTNSRANPDANRDVEAETRETTPLVMRRTDSPAKPKRRVDEKTYLLPGYEFEAPSPKGRLPRGSVRGRFIGETPDGRWMFELPSREIVTVRPPPSR